MKPARPVAALPQGDGLSRAATRGGVPSSVAPPSGVPPAASEPKEPGLVRPAEVGAQAEQTSASEPDSEAALGSVTGLAFSAPGLDPSSGAERVYFSVDPMGQKLGTMEPWAPGEERRFDEANITASNNANVSLAPLPPVPLPAREPPPPLHPPSCPAQLPRHPPL